MTIEDNSGFDKDYLDWANKAYEAEWKELFIDKPPLSDDDLKVNIENASVLAKKYPFLNPPPDYFELGK